MLRSMSKCMFALAVCTFCLMIAVESHEQLLHNVSLTNNSSPVFNLTLSGLPPSQHKRIIGGERVRRRSEVAYQVSLRFNNHHVCGGSIYKPQYVITAAHCVSNNDPSNLLVVAGDTNLRQATAATQTSTVERIIIHPNYTKVIYNDIALLKLRTPFKFNENVNAIPIYNWSIHHTRPFDRCKVSGWGALHYQGQLADDLHATYIYVYSHHDCHKIYGSNYEAGTMLCAGDSGVSRDACNGDSGGPLVCHNGLYGVVSWGVDCGKLSYPGVYTNASHFATWLNVTANRTSSLPLDKSLLAFLISLIVTSILF